MIHKGFRKLFWGKIPLIVFTLTYVRICLAANPGDVIVDNAKTQLGKSYQSGQPPNKEWIYGGVFDLENWTGGYDCSGLVSYAGGLRRHYTVDELHSFVSNATWSALQSGNLIMSSGHVIIFEGGYTDALGTKRLITIEVSYEEEEVVRRGPGESLQGYKDPAEYSDAYLITEGYLPYSFKTDSTPPEINVSGIEDGGVYNEPVTVTFSATDNIEVTPYAYAEYQGTKFLEKTFSDDGQYTISFHSQDWLKNPKDIVHHFRIGPPFTLTVNPPLAEVSKGETVTHTVTIKNNYVPESETFSLSAYGFSPGWSVSGLSESFSLEPGRETSYTFLVTSSDGYGDVDISVDLIAMAETRSQEVYDWSAEPYNPREHPDETYEISSTNYPTPWKIDTKSKIGILLSGWGNGLGHLLGRWNVETVGVKPDLTIVGEPKRDLNDLDVLLIGTGGLTGLENSSTFRNKLVGFVSQGGVIICLTSQYGYELNGLPGSPSGYGWSEDQSCHTNAAYIDTYHPIFSGQDSATLDASADGYLTKWPSEATVLLRRTKNQMPAMVKYDYGQGKIVVLTFYSETGKDRKLL